MRIGAVVLFCLLFACIAMNSVPAKAQSLCLPRETSYFSCRVVNNKWIALCGGPDGSIQYRFGTHLHLELQFPPDASAKQALRFAHYFRYRTDRIEVTFSLGAVTYVIFQYYEGSKRSAGVRVVLESGREAVKTCLSEKQSRLSDLKALLPCDTDNALNMGECSQ
jgi:hypothetical protein